MYLPTLRVSLSLSSLPHNDNLKVRAGYILLRLTNVDSSLAIKASEEYRSASIRHAGILENCLA